MKEKYVEAQVEIIEFEEKDVIIASGDVIELPFVPCEDMKIKKL